jgi:7-keto-8-aminopelargonate synthetase-like enzyme
MLSGIHRRVRAALVFTSGYVSNETGIATIAGLLPNCLLLSDALNHNSMIEGVRRSGCEKQIWRHNDLGHLEELLKAADPARAKLIVFESLYSMDAHGVLHLLACRDVAAQTAERLRQGALDTRSQMPPPRGPYMPTACTSSQ